MNIVTQTGAPWGLARLSHLQKLTLGTFKKYDYEDGAGEGVDVYVLDTGIYIDNNEFEGRASWGKSIINETIDKDTDGHGTHCAGTVASKKYGVSKKANVVAVKIANNSGGTTQSALADGIDWIVESHKKNTANFQSATTAAHFKASVALLATPQIQADGSMDRLRSALDAAIEEGVHVVTPAGNENEDSCIGYGMPSAAFKVGASALSDVKAFFSNYGPCVDLFAPGLDVQSIWNDDASRQVLSGTEMAAAHVAGLVAYFLSMPRNKYPDFDPTGITPVALKNFVLDHANAGSLTGLPDETRNVSSPSIISSEIFG